MRIDINVDFFVHVVYFQTKLQFLLRACLVTRKSMFHLQSEKEEKTKGEKQKNRKERKENTR